MKNTEEAFVWVVNVLQVKNIEFQITGGFAARLYGSERELADIDIDIHDKDFDAIVNDIQPYIISGPEYYTDENWKLKIVTLDYKGQVIDICGEATIFDATSKEWVLILTDFSKNKYINAYGIEVPVISKESLIFYKSKLLREVDVEDIEALK